MIGLMCPKKLVFGSCIKPVQDECLGTVSPLASNFDNGCLEGCECPEDTVWHSGQWSVSDQTLSAGLSN